MNKTTLRTLTVMTLAAMTLNLSGCQWADDNRIAAGAITGTVLGAAAGALIDDNSGRGALIGAAAGGLLGAGVGAVLQNQKESFDRIEGLEANQRAVHFPQPVQVDGAQPPPIERESLNIRFSNVVVFEKGRSALTTNGARKLQEFAAVVNEYPDSTIYIRGYASNEGTDDANTALSIRRADVVKNQMIQFGVRAGRIQAAGFGSSTPVESNTDEFGRMQNRRVEIDIVPSGN